uniref:Uncharacterized protein n=1 Tax=Oryza brachyantha TaxID=4533 RepID=J3MJ04_ORYBR
MWMLLPKGRRVHNGSRRQGLRMPSSGGSGPNENSSVVFGWSSAPWPDDENSSLTGVKPASGDSPFQLLRMLRDQ